MKKLILALAFVPSICFSALQTSTAFIRIESAPSSLRGEDFDSIVSVEETERPPGGGVAPAVIGPVAEGVDYLIDEAAGTIQAAPDREPFWAKVVYQWDDTPSAEEAEHVAAEADCSISKPALRARIIQDLADIQQEMDRAQQIQDQMVARIAAFAGDTALPASPTVVQLRTAFNTLSSRYQQNVAAMRDVAIGSKRSGNRFRGLARLVACQAGIAVNAP